MAVMDADDDEVIELTESGGVVGVPLRYAVRLRELPGSLRAIAERLASRAADAVPTGSLPGADRTTSELRLSRAGRTTTVSTASADPDEIERLLGAIRAHPVRRSGS